MPHLTSTDNMTIRLAQPADAPAIASLLAESFAEYQSFYTIDGYAATAIPAAEIVARMKDGPVWIACPDEVIAGTVSVVARGESLYIRGMAVLPAARGMRIGAALLTHVQQFAAAEHFPRLFLSTTPFLDRAIRLYEQFGFRRTHDGPNDLFGTPLFSMEKLISG